MSVPPQQQGEFVAPLEVWKRATQKQFFNVSDATQIGKLKFEVATYAPDYAQASAYLDFSEVRLVSHLVGVRLFSKMNFPPTKQVGVFEKFGGGGSTGYSTGTESRTIKLEWSTEGGFDHIPYRLTISRTAGIAGANGAIQPLTADKQTPQDKESSTRQQMRFAESDLLEALLAAVAFLNAFEASQFHIRYADLLAEQQGKRDQRAKKKAKGGAAPTHNDRRAMTRPVMADPVTGEVFDTGAAQVTPLVAGGPPAKEGQLTAIRKIGGTRGLTPKLLDEMATAQYGVPLPQLSEAQAGQMIGHLQDTRV